jgi:ABC-type lipoprotein release transport system permease subunit
MLVPLSYNLRSLWVRRSSTLLTVFGLGATVAIVSAVLALQQGFSTMFTAGGRADIAVFLRPGATGEGDSIFRRDLGQRLIKTLPEIEVDAEKGPLASMEAYLAVLARKVDGGETNVPLRGVQPQTFRLRGDEVRIVAGRNFTPGSDEVIVGKSLVSRLQNTSLDDVIVLNTTPFRVVGIFEHDGAFASEIWGDLERFMPVLGRYGPNRVIAKLRPGTDLVALSARLENDKEVPAKVQDEQSYLASQTVVFGAALLGLGVVLGVIMGIGAIFAATNTMLAAVSSRTSEIGILLSLGYRPVPIFLAFQLEALLVGLLGGLLGCLLALPLNGIETGAMNWQTFTEFAFAFQVTPKVLVAAVAFSLLLGLLGGAWPAWRAARLKPTVALRQG